MSAPLRPTLIRTLDRLDRLLQTNPAPAHHALYAGLGLASSRSALLLKELRGLGLVGRTRAHGHIWLTAQGKAVLAEHRAVVAIVPNGVNIQLPVGQRLPIIPGLPVKLEVTQIGQEWRRNLEPEGVTT